MRVVFSDRLWSKGVPAHHDFLAELLKAQRQMAHAQGGATRGRRFRRVDDSDVQAVRERHHEEGECWRGAGGELWSSVLWVLRSFAAPRPNPRNLGEKLTRLSW
jgi:hypothetical protein